MSAIELDRGRLEALTVFTPVELGEIAKGVIEGTAEVLDAIETGIESGDLAAVVQAAHRGRNEALLVGARELDGVFATLEAAARRSELQVMRESIASLRTLWPATRSAIERLPADAKY